MAMFVNKSFTKSFYIADNGVVDSWSSPASR